jgi:hypothetical protein
MHGTGSSELQEGHPCSHPLRYIIGNGDDTIQDWVPVSALSPQSSTLPLGILIRSPETWDAYIN